MTLREAVQYACTFLNTDTPESASLDSEILVCKATGLTRLDLLRQPEKEIQERQIEILNHDLNLRSNKMPIAYITGEKEFFGFQFKVNPSVLIPRPETEELVEWVLEDLNASKPDHTLSILDLCSGSGCIGIAIAANSKNTHIWLSDISHNALETSSINANCILSDSSRKNIFYVQGDLFQNLKELQFDTIVCNPPYIPLSEKPVIMEDVQKYEPQEALFLEDVLNFYSRILVDAQIHLKPKGKLYLELNPDFFNEIADIGNTIGWKKIIARKDLSGKNRMMRLEAIE